MKILYIAIRGALSEGSGVLKKIIAQIDALNDCGVIAKGLIFYTKDPHRISRKFHKNNSFHKIKCHNNIWNGEWYKNLILYNQIIREINKEEFDLIYFRYPKASLQLLRLVKQFPFKVIFEHQTKELDEIKQAIGEKNKEFFIEKYLSPFIFRYVRGFVAVTSEIERYERKRYSYNNRYKQVSLTLGNGFDIKIVPLRTSPHLDKFKLELLFVGQISPWHGVDRILRGMANYKGNVDINFHIVGTGNALKNTIRLVKDLNLDNKVIFHGQLSGKSLDELFNQCHIAVASLGLYRNNLYEASSLKTREYIARGIPFIISYKDTDLKKKNDIQNVYLQFKDNNDPIDMDEVIRFINRVYEIDNFEKLLREFSLRNIDMKIKMQKLKKFFDRCLIEQR